MLSDNNKTESVARNTIHSINTSQNFMIYCSKTKLGPWQYSGTVNLFFLYCSLFTNKTGLRCTINSAQYRPLFKALYTILLYTNLGSQIRQTSKPRPIKNDKMCKIFPSCVVH